MKKAVDLLLLLNSAGGIEGIQILNTDIKQNTHFLWF